MYRYKFTVEFCDEIYGDPCKRDCGYVFGNTLMDATEKVANYYGEDAINRLYLEPDCGDQLIVLQENMTKFDTNWIGPAQNGGF